MSQSRTTKVAKTRHTKQRAKRATGHKPSEIVGQVDLREIAEILVKRFDLHEGLYEPSLDIRIAVGNLGSPQLPSAALGIAGIGIVRTETESEHSVDAAKVNPATIRRRRT